MSWIIVGANIKALRLSHKYTVRQLAQRLGVSPSSITLWEKGRREPSSGNRDALCRIFGIEEYKLFQPAK